MTAPLQHTALTTKLRHYLGGVVTTRRESGWIAAARFGTWRVRGFMHRQWAAGRAWIYDRRRGVDTAVDYPGIEHPSNAVYDDAVFYGVIPPRAFTRLIKDTGVRPADFTFVDLGSGKGAAMLMALEAGFRSVVGVELNDRLVSITERNVETYLRRLGSAGEPPEAAVVSGDVINFQFPQSPTVVFMYNPFGAETLAAVLRRLEQSLREHPREVVIAYASPWHDHVVEASPAFERVGGTGRAATVKWSIFRSLPA